MTVAYYLSSSCFDVFMMSTADLRIYAHENRLIPLYVLATNVTLITSTYLNTSG